MQILENTEEASAHVPALSPATFTVATAKPHYSCSSRDGQDRVRRYIEALLQDKTGLIALNQMEFALNASSTIRPNGYIGLGGSCGPHHDSAVLLINDAQFQVLHAIGETSVGNFSLLPYIASGVAPSGIGSMCVASNYSLSSSRPYAGAIIRHRASNRKMCTIVGTFPHCDQPWNDSFVENIRTACRGLQILFLVDTNAGCPGGDPNTPARGANDSLVSMETIAARHGASWGGCSDPAVNRAPTCCDDIKKGFPYARLWFDRTALCGSTTPGESPGVVKRFQVGKTFVCGGDEEHLYTSALVDLN